MRKHNRFTVPLFIMATVLSAPNAWGMTQEKDSSIQILRLPDCHHSVKERLDDGAFLYHLVRDAENDPRTLNDFIRQEVPIAFPPGTQLSPEEAELDSFHRTYALSSSEKQLADALRESGQDGSHIHYDNAIEAVESYLKAYGAVANDQARDQELTHRITLMAILGVSYYNKTTLLSQLGVAPKDEISSLALKSVEVFEEALKVADTLELKNDGLFQEMEKVISSLKAGQVGASLFFLK